MQLWSKRVRAEAMMHQDSQSGLTVVSSAARSWRWKVCVPLVFAVAGLMFATSHADSRGTDLRSTATSVNLAGLVRSQQTQLDAQAQSLAVLQARVKAATDAAAHHDAAVAAEQSQVTPLLAPAGFTAVTGAGLTVTLDDAHGNDVSTVTGVDANELVVHQSDLQAVVNALWAGGAEAMTIAGQRVIATSAVRCVGNTLLLNGKVYSPPFRVAAIGPARTMQSELNASPGVQLYKQAASYYGLEYSLATADQLSLPAYDQAITLSYAQAVTNGK